MPAGCGKSPEQGVTTCFLIEVEALRIELRCETLDRSGLRVLGFIFATVTLAVMLTTGLVVKGYADGAYSLEAANR